MRKRLRAGLVALLLAWPTVLCVQSVLSQSAPDASDKDICSYLKDVEAKTDADCSPENLAALKSKNPETLVLAQKRKADVLKAYDALKSSPPPETAPTPLQPAINERTFAAWLPDAKDLKDIEARRLQALNQSLQQEKKSAVSPERQKEIDTGLSANQAKLAALDKIRDPEQLRCFLGEGCGARSDASVPAVTGATGHGAWTPEDYARANAEARTQTRVPGGRIDIGVPNLGSVASDAFANTPLGPLRDKTSNGSSSPFGAAALTAFGLTGGLLLFGGLAGPQLEDKFPNIRRNMGIAALMSGVIATGGIAWEVGATRMAAIAAPLAVNAETQQESTQGLATEAPAIAEPAKTVLDFARTKGEAQGIISKMNLPEEQARSALSAIRKATTSSNFRITREDADVIIRTVRRGRDGYQLFEYRVTPTGDKAIVQTAYDAAGNLVHYDPK